MYPTVKLRDLIGDGGFTDHVFKTYVARWMDIYMPGFPMGLIDTTNIERWSFEPDKQHTVVRVEHDGLRCKGCDTFWDEQPADPCCTLNICDECEESYLSKNVSCCGMGMTSKPAELVRASKRMFAVKNEDTGEYLYNQKYIRYLDLEEDHTVEIENENVMAWEDEYQADQAAMEADRGYHDATFHEKCYGFPWAHSWVHLPDSRVSTDSLRSAGFRVAEYVGGDGSTNEDTYRLAGIDGGGYSFEDSHFARLVALHHIQRGQTVDTTNGHVYVTMDYRSDLEKLAQDSQESGV